MENMSRFDRMIKAQNDYKNGLITEEEFREIMDDCDAYEFMNIEEE